MIESSLPHVSPSVSVVITAYNHAHFLSDAIESVLGQTVRASEILVVDDGSTDDTSDVAARYSGVRYIRQDNQGLSAARNTGLRECRGECVVFLDADDRLLPGALAAGLSCFSAYPESAFVSGRHRRISRDGRAFAQPTPRPVHRPHYHAFLRGNYIGMHGAVMYRRDVLEQVGGFDVTLPACEDYDVYLRIAREHPVARHEETVAEYRIHGDNMSENLDLMISAALRVLSSQREYVINDPSARAAYVEGMRNWRDYYGRKLLSRVWEGTRTSEAPGRALKAAWTLARFAPAFLASRSIRVLSRYARRAVATPLPPSVRNRLRRSHNGQGPSPPLGELEFGDLRRLVPVSRRFGFDRGRPIDRYYIEAFLGEHASSIRGRVLEIGDDEYTIRFGGELVTRRDVLHVNADNPKATFVDDLASGETLPSDAFDCVILTQTLHLIYDVRAAVSTLHRILKPGGVLLMTVPGTISQLEAGTWADVWHWGFTALSIRKLCSESFASDHIEINTHGSVLTAIAFLQGLAAEELRPGELNHHDPLYPVLITVRVRKPEIPEHARVASKTEEKPTAFSAVQPPPGEPSL